MYPLEILLWTIKLYVNVWGLVENIEKSTRYPWVYNFSALNMHLCACMEKTGIYLFKVQYPRNCTRVDCPK